MAKKKRSFFERLTGTVSLDDFEEDELALEIEALPQQHICIACQP